MEFSLEQIPMIAQQIITNINQVSSLEHATLVTFSGDLGAGKTTLIQEIAKQLGVVETLQSPTYVIYKRYKTSPRGFAVDPLLQGEGGRTVVHADMYRLESSDEILKLGWNELLADPKNILLVEWPEKITDVIPPWAVKVAIKHKGGDFRIVDII
jgi:tRNA threonylcarbamoyladenosine biosynthesis protein TsaE